MKSSITAEYVARYVTEQITKDSELEVRLRTETAKLPEAGMISPPDVGAFLAILAQTVQTRRAVEIGTFTGYTALKMASVLPKDGKLVCLDHSEYWTRIALKFWQEANVAEKIDLRLGEARPAITALLKSEGANTYDFAFIDADKPSYEHYYENCLQLVRPGGLVVLDNMLWDGEVANPETQDSTTKILRGLNEKISRDPRVEACLLTVGDGLMLARKR